MQITFGNTTSVTGNVSLSLPVTAEATVSEIMPIGFASMYDNSISGLGGCGFIRRDGKLRVYRADGTYLVNASLNSLVPFTWTTSDVLLLHGFYEAD